MILSAYLRHIDPGTTAAGPVKPDMIGDSWLLPQFPPVRLRSTRSKHALTEYAMHHCVNDERVMKLHAQQITCPIYMHRPSSSNGVAI